MLQVPERGSTFPHTYLIDIYFPSLRLAQRLHCMFFVDITQFQANSHGIVPGHDLTCSREIGAQAESITAHIFQLENEGKFWGSFLYLLPGPRLLQFCSDK